MKKEHLSPRAILSLAMITIAMLGCILPLGLSNPKVKECSVVWKNKTQTTLTSMVDMSYDTCAWSLKTINDITGQVEAYRIFSYP